MVDLLSRAGRLREAIELIEGMPMKPDVVIWRSILSASLERGASELAEVAGKKVLRLELDNDAVYELLRSAYRSVNRWDDALRTAKTMRDQRIKKTHGGVLSVTAVVKETLKDRVTQLDGKVDHLDGQV
ncbi:Pentatricopeptide repeat-containing protein [Forsythia ovata]|uniref:Pentatricopeptide repeat-containing protein n=1 Tax=Forsythia ovata TaxID=205694 RepID=A0ABD1VIC4_9LAMI